MADETAKLKAKLANLNNSLDGLEEALEPLLSQSLPETVVNLETIQQAKLQVAIPYLVYDLVFIYLKTRGVDPKTHPVIAELDRVRQYFDKIKNAENPPKRTLPVDKDAANRFIKHAISQVRQMAPVAGPSTHVKFDDAGIAHDIRDIPVKVTEKMLAREEYEKELREAGSDEEEEELEVIDDAEEEEEPSAADRKGKGKAASPPEDTSTELGSKRRRKPVDPFAGGLWGRSSTDENHDDHGCHHDI
ncbi:hypothetical protein EWM64_g10331 [Hericium alpestre]|uniref:Exosome complex protein n=1 Tax=Hericium alpestre TaxID=135208 RepID=A0A4Y9ZHM4_9AGAM|nr:hypothetical protein EWM64_g10331 [Hericium alpestre]